MDPTDEDENLRQNLRDLDQAAWTALFNEHQAKIWRYVFARTGSKEVADDTTSQVFVEALESIYRFRYRGRPILAWLYRIARNHLGKRFRSAKREVGGPTPEPSADPIEATLDAIALSDALASLTREQADAVALRFFPATQREKSLQRWERASLQFTRSRYERWPHYGATSGVRRQILELGRRKSPPFGYR